MTSTQLLLASSALALDREIIIHIRLYLPAGWDVSEGEADISEVLIVLLVALHVLPLADGLGKVHHAQRNLDLPRNIGLVLGSLQTKCLLSMMFIGF